MNEKERQFFKNKLNGLKVYPGNTSPKDFPENAQWLVCSKEPVHAGRSQVSNCCVCNCPIYFSSKNVTLNKICTTCMMKQSKPDDVHFMNEQTLVDIIMYGKMN